MAGEESKSYMYTTLEQSEVNLVEAEGGQFRVNSSGEFRWNLEVPVWSRRKGPERAGRESAATQLTQQISPQHEANLKPETSNSPQPQCCTSNKATLFDGSLSTFGSRQGLSGTTRSTVIAR